MKPNKIRLKVEDDKSNTREGNDHWPILFVFQR